MLARSFALLLVLLALSAPARAQGASLPELAARLAAMTAVTGYEQAVTDTLLTLLPGSTRDRAGNVVLTLGQGAPRRLLACPLDEAGYIVGNIRDDGYLTLRSLGDAATSPLFDQYQLEGHRVTVFGRRGPVPGVVAVRSIHLTRGRAAGPDEPFTVDDALVDLGAERRAVAESLGVAVLAPVASTKRPQRYGSDLLAAPVAGRRGACAALLAAARPGARVTGTVVVAFLVEQNLSLRGLRTVTFSQGPFAETLLVDGGAGEAGTIQQAANIWWIPTRYTGSPVETVALNDVETMRRQLVAWLGASR